jgi:hypothetical protein
MGQRTDVLCGCGWGRIGIPLDDVPQECPVCGFNFWEAFGAPWEHEEDECAS